MILKVVQKFQYACNEIMKRLKPVIDKNPNGTWEEWIKTAYFERISLSATGFYKTPDIGYSFETNTGNPFNYFTYGVACSEVEIDCLTGDHQVNIFQATYRYQKEIVHVKIYFNITINY